MSVTLNKKNFKRSVIITIVAGIFIMTASFIYGHTPLFLLLNTDAGLFPDYFFRFYTNMGDGLIWLPALLIVIFVLKQKQAWKLVFFMFAISTLIVQLIKQIILTEQLRPSAAITDATQFHTVNGVELYRSGSFPSGHTATAFCIYILFCMLLHSSWWLFVGFVYAVLVGYSRIYLAEHFPLDVGGGMIAAALSAIISWWLFQKLNNKNAG